MAASPTSLYSRRPLVGNSGHCEVGSLLSGDTPVFVENGVMDQRESAGNLRCIMIQRVLPHAWVGLQRQRLRLKRRDHDLAGDVHRAGLSFHQLIPSDLIVDWRSILQPSYDTGRNRDLVDDLDDVLRELELLAVDGRQHQYFVSRIDQSAGALCDLT